MNSLRAFISCRSLYTLNSLRKSPDTHKQNNNRDEEVHFHIFISFTMLDPWSLTSPLSYLHVCVCVCLCNDKCTKYWRLFVWADAVEREAKEWAQFFPQQSNKCLHVAVIDKPVWENPEINNSTLKTHIIQNVHIKGTYTFGLCKTK